MFVKFGTHAHHDVCNIWCEFGNDPLINDGDVSLLRTSVVNLTLLRPRKLYSSAKKAIYCVRFRGGRGGLRQAYAPYVCIKWRNLGVIPKTFYFSS